MYFSIIRLKLFDLKPSYDCRRYYYKNNNNRPTLYKLSFNFPSFKGIFFYRLNEIKSLLSHAKRYELAIRGVN